MNIYLKLVLLCLFMVLFASGSLYYFVNEESRQTLETQIAVRLERQSSFAVSSIDRFIFERLIDIKQLAQDPILTREDKIDTAVVADRLKELKLKNPLYESISFFDNNRLRVADSENNKVGETHALEGYWKKIDGDHEVVMDIDRSESLQKVVFHFASVVRNDYGERLGVIVSRVDVNKMHEIIEEILVQDSLMQVKNVDLIDRDGFLLYSNHNPEGLLTQKYDQAEVLKYFKETDEHYHEFDDKLYFYTKETGYSSYAGSDWAMIIAVPREVAYKPVYELRFQVLLTLIPVILLSVVLALLIARFFVKPIVSLTNVAQQMAKGDLDAHLKYRGSDEIGKLAESFSKMAATIKLKIKEQEDANAELNAINERIETKYAQINEQKIEIELQRDQIEMQNSALNEAFNEIEKQNKAITASINYAERIQRSTLPDHEIFNQYFPKSFVLYKPRDIVSGDFYWFDEVEKENEKYLVIAVGDCTGHGVPGGFMSMLGNNLLTTIVSLASITDPMEILKEINDDIRKMLHQDSQVENSRDGMELSLCTINLKTKQLFYAGAGRPLYLFREGQFIECKGDRASLGGVTAIQRKKNTIGELNLQVHQFYLQENDVIYLFSDGYKDQFGGEDGRVYSSKRFKNLLYKIHQKPMEKQRELLAQELENWKDGRKQTDDIVVLGFKV
ncbi:SpoIIE family protein phosphatase [Hugenholtzia roseola]|uniref:SpoIIE family protein phosphatase n=1 Tax=Hugenholtzia roseola TaxID=1002 RepID=UPI000A32A45E|nr:SpoIIE family protein phosphatase [Hugenholtzia roseola]